MFNKLAKFEFNCHHKETLTIILLLLPKASAIELIVVHIFGSREAVPCKSKLSCRSDEEMTGPTSTWCCDLRGVSVSHVPLLLQLELLGGIPEGD